MLISRLQKLSATCLLNNTEMVLMNYNNMKAEELYMLIKDKYTILFQGDSNVECGRSKVNPADLGTGYVKMIQTIFSTLHPDKDVIFINRGIGGNRVQELTKRWQTECIDLKPDIVSISVGICDCLRNYKGYTLTDTAQYEQEYRDILIQVKEKTNAEIIMIEPFVFPAPEDIRRVWREDIDPKIAVTRSLAIEFGALYIPLDGIFASSTTRKPPNFWSPDSVHLTRPGMAVVAKAWLEAVGAM